MKLILVLPFMDMGSLGSVFNGGATVETKAQKDTYYRALTNQKMNWRNLLLLFVKRYLSLEQKFTTPKDIHKCLIFDDTDIGKRGKKIEGASKVFDLSLIHISEPTRRTPISYAVFCLKKKKKKTTISL